MPSRRTVLLTGTAAALAAGGYALSRGPDAEAAAAALRVPRDPASFEGLVHFATLAANSYNAQAWRFRATPDGVAIRPDLARALPVADPDHHHLYASLGAAAENLILASSRTAALAFDPAGEGRVDIALGASAPADPLAAAILARQCTRSDYDGRTVPPADLAALEAAARVDGAEVLLVTDPAQIARILDLILAANEAQVSDPAFAAELKSWIRFSARAAVETGDGLFSAASGNPVLPDPLGRVIFDWVFTVRSENDRYARQVRSSSGLAIIHSDRDDPAHWVQAGRSYQRFALQATALGIRHAHLNQPVEIASTRPQLQSLLGLGSRRPDLLLRFGYAPPMPRSLRRPVAAVIEA